MESALGCMYVCIAFDCKTAVYKFIYTIQYQHLGVGRVSWAPTFLSLIELSKRTRTGEINTLNKNKIFDAKRQFDVLIRV